MLNFEMHCLLTMIFEFWSRFHLVLLFYCYCRHFNSQRPFLQRNVGHSEPRYLSQGHCKVVCQNHRGSIRFINRCLVSEIQIPILEAHHCPEVCSSLFFLSIHTFFHPAAFTPNELGVLSQPISLWRVALKGLKVDWICITWYAWRRVIFETYLYSIQITHAKMQWNLLSIANRTHWK